MKLCWVVIYSHRHGEDAWPVFQSKRPTQEEVAKGIAEEGEPFEPDRGETIEIRGPWEVPNAQH